MVRTLARALIISLLLWSCQFREAIEVTIFLFRGNTNRSSLYALSIHHINAYFFYQVITLSLISRNYFFQFLRLDIFLYHFHCYLSNELRANVTITMNTRTKHVVYVYVSPDYSNQIHTYTTAFLYFKFKIDFCHL